MARKDFDDDTNYRGGGLSDPKPKIVRRYPCFADGCPMPGTIFLGETQGTGDKLGSCAWHYGVLPHDIPKVTAVLRDWDFLAKEVNECRRAHTTLESACSPKALDALFASAIERVRVVKAGGWGDEFESQPGERYHSWGARMERFLGARVVEVLSTHQRRIA